MGIFTKLRALNRRHLIFPSIQLKFASIHLVAVTMAAVGAWWIMKSLNRQVMDLVEQTGDPGLQSAVLEIQDHQMQILIALGWISGLIMFIISILSTHRFLGPVVGIIRYLESLRTKGQGDLKIRGNDALTPLVEYMNSVEIKVSDSKPNERGMSLIEVMISVSVLSVVMLGLASNMDLYQREVSRVQLKSSRTSLSNLIRNEARDSASLYNSADLPGATALKNCLQGLGSNPCTHNAKAEYVFASAQRTEAVVNAGGSQAVDASGNAIFNAPAIGGPTNGSCGSSAPSVYYTNEGRRCACTESPGVCPLQIVTSFTTFCSTGTTCTRPSSVRLDYAIKLRSGVTENQGNVTNFKPETGQSFFELANDEYYVKFVYASSTKIDPVTGDKLTSVSSSVAEQEVRKGEFLEYQKPSLLDFNVSYVSTKDVSKLRLLRYLYPVGCSISNLGTNASVNGTSANCTPPSSSAFSVVKDLPPGTARTGVIGTTDILTTDQVAEYQVESLDSGGAVIERSRLPVRAAFEDAYVNVTPPPQIRFVCDPSSTVNTFKFIMTSPKTGWKSVKALLNPPGSFNGNSYPELPGFETLDINQTTQQSLVVDSKYFTPGGTYEITLKGVTGNGEIKIDRKTFTAAAKPPRGIMFTSPYSGSKVRALKPLNVATLLNLECGEIPSAIKFGITRQDSGASVMPEQSGAWTCSVSPGGAVDENRYACTNSFTCEQWLNVQGGETCASKMTADTQLIGRATFIAPSKSDISNTTNFTAGSMISAKLHANSIQTVFFKASGLAPPSSVPVQVVFSSPLISGETAPIKINGVTYNCKIGGGNNTTYSGSTCTIRIPTPADSAVYTIQSGADNVEISAPDTTTVKIVGEDVLSCAVPPSGTTSCPTGKSLKRKFTLLASQDAYYDSLMYSVNYTLLKSDSSLDFFTSYRPTSATNDPTSSGWDLIFGLSEVDVLNSYLKPSDIVRCESSDRCAGGYSVIPHTAYDAKRSYGLSMSIRTRVPTDMTRDVGVIRECFCD